VPTATVRLPILVGIDNRNGGTLTVTGVVGRTLDIICEGAGPITLTGSADTVTVETNGAATVDLSGLTSVSLTVTGDDATVITAAPRR